MAQNTAQSIDNGLEGLQMSTDLLHDAPSELLTEGSGVEESTGSNTPSTLGNSQISTATAATEGDASGTGSKRGRGADRHSKTMKHFELLKEGSKQFSGIFLCKHCRGKKLNWENSVWNSTVAVKHLIECPSVPVGIKQELSSSSRGHQKATKYRGQKLGASDGSIMSFGSTSHSQDSSMPSSTIETKSKRSSQKTMDKYVEPPHAKSVLDGDYADRVVRSKIEEYLSHYVSPCWLLVDYRILQMFTSSGDGIQRHIPSRDEVWTITNNIDVDTQECLIQMLRQQPGNLSVGFDGVTALGQNAILYTRSFLLKVFKPFKEAIVACSREDMPMSAYYPICVWLQQYLVQLLSEEPNVDELLGVRGGCIEMLRIIEHRFNMDGNDPAGQKVGLLDPYQIWAFVVDPFRLYLKPRVPLGHIPAIGHLSNAVDFYLRDSGFKEALASSIMKEFDPIYQRLGIYMYKYRAYGEPPDDPPPTTFLTLGAIIAWVERFGCLNGRLTFFCGEEYQSTNYYKMVAGPLLSLKTAGSITVERAAKPLKNGVQSPERNALSHTKKIMCLRAGMNLNLKMLLRKQATTTCS